MSVLAGTPRLVRLALRRDRVVLPAWIVALGGLVAGIVASVTGLYASEQERVAAATFGAASPVARVFDGPASGTSVGAMTMVETYGFLAILVALMSAQAVVRHTRADEETGRAELLGSAVVGRHARLTAALCVVAAANLVLGLAVTGILLAAGLPVTGAVLSGAAVIGIGCVFAGVAAVTAQVFDSTRGANAAAGAVLGVVWLLRAAGDAFGEVAPSGVELVSAWPSWLSPIGWGQQIRPFHADNGLLLLLFVGTAVALVAAAFVLTSRRDVGAGMIGGRPGPARAGRGLRRPLGLAWRLQRGLVLAWAIGLLVGGAAFGAVGEAADDLVGISEQLEQALRAMAPGGSFVELYVTFVFGFLGIAAAAFTVQSVLRARGEEAAGRLEPLLSTAVSRPRWLASHVVIAVAGTVGLLTTAGLAAGLAFGALTGQWEQGLSWFLGAALVQVPPALVLGGLVVAAIGVVPRAATAIGWSAVVLGLVVGQLGALFDLPQAVLNVSPFTHAPLVPAEPFSVLPVLVLLAVAAVLCVIGFVRLGRRDLVAAA